MEKGTIRYVFRWSRQYMTAYRKRYVFLVLLTFIFVALNLLQVNFIEQSINAALKRGWLEIVGIAICFLALTAARTAQSYAFEQCANFLEANIGKDIKNSCADTVLHAQIPYLESQASGDFITKVNDDLAICLRFIKNGYINFIVYPLMALGGFFYLLTFNWKLSVLAFLMMPLLSLGLNHLSTRAGRISGQILPLRGRYMEQVYDAFHGAETIKAYAMQPFLKRKAQDLLKKLYDKEMEYTKNNSVTLGFIQAVGYIPEVIVLIYGGVLVMRGELPVSVLFAYGQLIPFVNTPAINLFSSFNEMKKACQSMKRLDTLKNAPQERTNGENFVRNEKEGIRFEGVSFAYSEGELILNRTNLSAFPGRIVGIAGESGAGKTTLVHLLCGLCEASEGTITVLGKKIGEWNLAALRSNIAYVSQDNEILPGTIEDNLRYARPQATTEEIDHAVTKAGLREFVDALPLGLQTPLAELGCDLSGGQRQRIGLCRAFLRDAPIWILDEPTSALDHGLEEFVMAKLRELTSGKTVLLISHKRSTLEICDQIYTLREGRLLKS